MRNRNVLMLAALMLIVALAAGCSSDDDDDDAGPAANDDDDNDDNDAADDDDNDTTDDDDDNDDDASPPYLPIRDENGRTLILHGSNFMAVEYGGQPIDYERMREWGFNVVRILITWAGIEPEQGAYDPDYFATQVEPQVQYAYEAGMHVILDMHHFHWSTCCGGMGMPEWICGDLPEFDLDWLFQSGLFWQNDAEVDAFVAAWEQVAEYFAGDDRVWAYDLFNEPLAGLRSLPWTFENPLLRPLYERLIPTIRAHHPEPFLMVEPSVVSLAGFPFVMTPLEEERLIYAPHLYPGFINGEHGYTFPKELVERHVNLRQSEADEQGLPLLIGETGLGNMVENAEQYAIDAVDLMEGKMAHWAWWAFGYDDEGMGLCYADGTPKEVFFPHLARPYPRATAGELRSFHFDEATSVFTMDFDNRAGLAPAVEIHVNADLHYPDGFAVTSTDPEGAWTHSFDAAAYTLTVTCDPASPAHTITVAPQGR